MRGALLVLGFGIVTACGSHPPPAPGTPGGASADSASPATSAAPGSASASPSASASASDASASMDSQREPFMQGCMKQVPAPDYCSCAFEQLREVFKDADPSQPIPDSDPRFETLHQRTISACGSKLPEDQIKAGFTASCIGNEPRKAPYCTCAWPALRKTLAVADFAGDLKGPRFEAAKKDMVAVCKGKFPTDVAKADFMTNCSSTDGTTTASCACVWKKLRGTFSTEEIVSGIATVDKVPGIDACRPK